MKITCPESTCRTLNDAQVEVCINCQTPLRGYAQLLMQPAHLFNRGLSLAREKNFARARDAFAAVVYWCPMDLEARNALAMACFANNDLIEARRQWNEVLKQSPSDPIAKQGLDALQHQETPAKPLPELRPTQLPSSSGDNKKGKQHKGKKAASAASSTSIRSKMPGMSIFDR